MESSTPQRPRLALYLATASLVLFVVVVVVCLIASLQARQVLCVYKGDLQSRVDQSEAFLRMTQAERVKAFGPALAKTPPQIVAAQLPNQRKTIQSFSGLHC